MANNRFVYKPTYALNNFKYNFSNQQDINNAVDEKTKKIIQQNQKKDIESNLYENYYKDLNDFINQGRMFPLNSDYHLNEESPINLRQYDRQIKKHPLFKSIKKQKNRKNKYFS